MNSVISRYSLIILILIFLVSINISCRKQNSTSKHIENKVIQMLVGQWEMDTYSTQKEKNYIEEWELIYVNQLAGKSYVLNKDQERKFLQNHFGLYKLNENWIYILELPEEKNMQLVSTKIEDNIIRFEQSSNQFPNYIQYTFINNNKIEVELGSSSNNEKQNYTLVKK